MRQALTRSRPTNHRGKYGRLLGVAALAAGCVAVMVSCTSRQGVFLPGVKTPSIQYQRDFRWAAATAAGDRFVVLESSYPNQQIFVFDEQFHEIGRIGDRPSPRGVLCIDGRGGAVVTLSATGELTVRSLPEGGALSRLPLEFGEWPQILVSSPPPFRFVAIDYMCVAPTVRAYGGDPPQLLATGTFETRLPRAAAVDASTSTLCIANARGELELISLPDLTPIHREQLPSVASLGSQMVCRGGRCWIAMGSDEGKFIEYDIRSRRITDVRALADQGEGFLALAPTAPLLVAACNSSVSRERTIVELRAFRVLDDGPLEIVARRTVELPNPPLHLAALANGRSAVLVGMWPSTVVWEFDPGEDAATSGRAP